MTLATITEHDLLMILIVLGIVAVALFVAGFRRP